MADQVPHVYAAINEVTAAMATEGLGKDRRNTQQGYSFRGIDDVYNALARHLARAKLCILPRVLERTVSERPTKSGGVSIYVVVDVEFDLVSAVDGSRHTIRTMGEAMDTADKATNKAMSAAMKYACLMTFQIPTEGDNDPDASHPEREPTPAQASKSARHVDATLVEALCLRIDAAERGQDLNRVALDTKKALANGQISDADYAHIVRASNAKAQFLNSSANGGAR